LCRLVTTLPSINNSNRSKRVGVAAMDLHAPRIILYQFGDDQIYTNTLTLLDAFDPVEILVPETVTGTTLYSLICEEFGTFALYWLHVWSNAHTRSVGAHSFSSHSSLLIENASLYTHTH
jgi:hypothetical protein